MSSPANRATTKDRDGARAELEMSAVAPARTITPPATTPLAQEQAGLDACVHCGFCLPACPTYLTLEDENDSPRGRIVLMRALAEETLAPTNDSLRTHIDRCLGCRACETACPSGVPYGNLLEATRATLRGGKAPTLLSRIILWTFAHPVLMRISMAMGKLLAATPIPTLAAKLPGRLGFAMAMLASTEPPIERARYAPTSDGGRGSAALLTGCVMEGIFTETNRATERVLVKNGYAMTDAPGQRCCGALHAHAGDIETARALARRNVEAFERSGAEYVVSNAAGCGAMMKEYGHLLAADPEWADRAAKISAKVRDVSELLAAAGPKRGGPVRIRVAYDAPCHLLHAQRIANPPLDVLRAIPELELVPLPESDVCCGSAGIYNLVEPDVSDRVLARKLSNVASIAAAPDVIATGNPGCLMQIGAGLIRDGSPTATIHPVELLDRSYAVAPPE